LLVVKLSAALPADDVNKMDFTVKFADYPGQTGVQYLLEVDIAKRGAVATTPCQKVLLVTVQCGRLLR
jgi:hypothetical protein